ncbi:MAG: ABC transporter substrate-binding protein [Pseudomonadota bacterium]
MKLRAIFRDSTITAILTCLIILTWTSNARSDEVIRVASIYAFSGMAALSQELSIKGVRSGILEVNNRGGVLGKKLMLIELDNKSSPIGTKVAADQAVKGNVVAIIGSAWSSHTLSAAKVAQAAGVPLITSISTLPGITDIGDYIFRTCFTDLFQGKVMAQFARLDLKAATAVVFENLNSDYSMSLSSEFCENFEKLGGKILLKSTYKDKQQDYSQIIEQAAQLHPDVLFIPGYDESGAIINKAYDAGLTAIPLGGDGWDMPDFIIKSAGKATGGYYCTHWSKDMDSEPSRNFVRMYYPYSQNDIGMAPAALAYDAVLLLADAISRAGSTDRSAIRQALAATQDFKGVTGTISFHGKGDPKKSAVIMKIIPNSAAMVKSISP